MALHHCDTKQVGKQMGLDEASGWCCDIYLAPMEIELTASEDSTARLWDVASGKRTGHEAWSNCH